MESPRQTETIGKILVALDATSSGLETLQAAAELAAQLPAELQCLFVEDIDLFRLATLPFAHEISITSAVFQPLDLEAMERALHRLADQARQSLSELAERLRVPWSFRVARGHPIRLPRESVEAVDVLILGSRMSRFARIGPVAPTPPRGPVVVLFDRSPGSERALAAALNLARGQPDELVVLLCGDGSGATLHDRVAKALPANRRQARVSLVPINSFSQLADTVGQCRGRLLLVARDAEFLAETMLNSLVNEVRCPVGLVR